VIRTENCPGNPDRYTFGFLPIPEPLFPKTSLMSVRPEPCGVGLASWSDARHWYLTWGDELIL
jgi:hypothetical protein